MKKGKFLIIGLMVLGLVLLGCDNGGSDDNGNDQHGVGNNNSTYAAGGFAVNNIDFNKLYGNDTTHSQKPLYYIPGTKAELQTIAYSTNGYDPERRTGLSLSEVKEALENGNWAVTFKNCFSSDATTIINKLKTNGYVVVTSNKLDYGNEGKNFVFLFYAFKE